MKNYHDYQKINLGMSDIASLTLRMPCKAECLNFGGDGDYSAYLVDGDAEIPEYYKEKFSTEGWLKIFDDNSLTQKISGRIIKIFRAGEYGCIIQVLGD